MEAVDLLVCDGCGRSFTSIDGPGMLRSLKGPCPDCGGRFQLKGKLPVDQAAAFDRSTAKKGDREPA